MYLRQIVPVSRSIEFCTGRSIEITWGGIAAVVPLRHPALAHERCPPLHLPALAPVGGINPARPGFNHRYQRSANDFQQTSAARQTTNGR
jgi:hypothetical protein